MLVMVLENVSVEVVTLVVVLVTTAAKATAYSCTRGLRIDIAPSPATASRGLLTRRHWPGVSQLGGGGGGELTVKDPKAENELHQPERWRRRRFC